MTLFYQKLLDSTQSERQQLSSIAAIQKALQGQLTQQEYLRFLSQAYHHVRHTVPLLMACGSRLWPRHQWLQEPLAEYIEEEIGHEQWILNDIAACGGDAESAKACAPVHETQMMVAYAYHQIDRANPIGFFGMVHVLEGTSIALASRAAQSIQDSLDLPDAGFSYLRSHGSLDQAHVQFFEVLMNRVVHSEDQQTIVHNAKTFYRLYGDIFRAITHDAN